MAELVWDEVGSRVYETGLDRGTLYLPDGSAVPWNGLTSIIEKFDKERNAVYYDGMKISDLVVLGGFTASMKAVTYPDEFLEVEGIASNKRGVYYADQMPQTFGLCYRTRIGNDVQGDEAGYKLHILYNVTAIPSDKTYATQGDSPSLVEFEWEITAVPEEIDGFRPTAHIIVDSREVDPLLLVELESILYGTHYADASLIPMAELIDRLNSFLRVEIIDNGDGTWSANIDSDLYFTLGLENYFEINSVNAWYKNNEEYTVTSTTGSGDVPQIKINDSGSGIWTATSDFPELIITLDVGEVQINNANTIEIDADTYQIQDTPSE